MLNTNNFSIGFNIESIEICDFDTLNKVTNQDILEMSRGDQNKKLLNFISKKMGIKSRYWVDENLNSFDMAMQVLKKLVEKDPKIVEEADFLIFGGISNPMPTVCIAALLACEFEFQNASCWDLKSGCSTGVLALQQALNSFSQGAKKGVIICSETFSKFTNNDNLQMAASIGDGAAGVILTADKSVQVLGSVHGTDASYFKTMYVPGKYPINLKNYQSEEYFFHFSDKADTLEKLGYYWNNSLTELLKISKIQGTEVKHYLSHQVDGTKNRAIALTNNIPEESIALNFEQFGNMGCPTIFINAYFWLQNRNISKNDTIVFHAVGGGLSWAGLCLKKVS